MPETRIIDTISKSRIIPVVVLEHVNDAIPLAEALLEGGLDVMEITLRTKAAPQCIELIANRLPDMLLGAGTVITKDQVRQARDLGAQFALAPGLNPEIVETANSVGLFFAPGVMTPSDIECALSHECKWLKFFPASAVGGPSMIRSISGPYAHTGIRLLPTGGISADTMMQYLAIPIVAAIGGSWMVDAELVRNKNWKTITRLTRDAVDQCAFTGA